MARSVRPVREPATEEDLLAVADAVRGFVSRRVRARSESDDEDVPGPDVDDVVQETVARVWETRWRLERGALLAYGVVVARNLLASARRDQAVQRRHAPRLAEQATADDPVTAVLAREERAALAAGLAGLRDDDRRLLLDHEVAGVDTSTLAAEHGTSAGAAAARLARARARLRVEHLLALRRVALPTPRCRPVLDALSLGDRRRQRALGAAEHLLGCATCAGLAEPLLTRRRRLTGLAPLAFLFALPGRAWAWARAHPIPATATVAGAVAVAMVAAFLAGDPAPPPPAAAAPTATASATAPAPAAEVSVDGVRLLPAAAVGSLRTHAGRRAVARDVPVESVPADEGFWVGAAPGRRIWVQLASRSESAVRVRPGQRASFTAAVRPAGTEFPTRVGVDPAEGASELRATGAYLLVDPDDLTVR